VLRAVATTVTGTGAFAAIALLFANVQGAVEPFASLLSLLPRRPRIAPSPRPRVRSGMRCGSGRAPGRQVLRRSSGRSMPSSLPRRARRARRARGSPRGAGRRVRRSLGAGSTWMASTGFDGRAASRSPVPRCCAGSGVLCLANVSTAQRRCRPSVTSSGQSRVERSSLSTAIAVIADPIRQPSSFEQRRARIIVPRRGPTWRPQRRPRQALPPAA
jgi:hypothetical protein